MTLWYCNSLLWNVKCFVKHSALLLISAGSEQKLVIKEEEICKYMQVNLIKLL